MEKGRPLFGTACQPPHWLLPDGLLGDGFHRAEGRCLPCISQMTLRPKQNRVLPTPKSAFPCLKHCTGFWRPAGTMLNQRLSNSQGTGSTVVRKQSAVGRGHLQYTARPGSLQRTQYKGATRGTSQGCDEKRGVCVTHSAWEPA